MPARRDQVLRFGVGAHAGRRSGLAFWAGFLGATLGLASAFELAVVPGREANTLVWTPIEGAEAYSVWFGIEERPHRSGEIIAQLTETSLTHGWPDDVEVQVAYYRVEAHGVGDEVWSPIRAAGRFAFERLDFFSPMVVSDYDRDGVPGFLLGQATDETGVDDAPRDRGLSSARPYPFFRGRSAVGDFNGDGFDDVMVAPYGPPGGTPLSQRYGRLYLNDGRGAFEEQPAFLENEVLGWSETPVVADFDNDADLDVYIPVYPNKNPDKGWLLLNDGSGSFRDVAATAGLAGELWPLPEGAQAVDINQDGWLDIYVSSRFFMNEGVSADGIPRFREDRFGLESRFDEGAQLIDWNRDGQWDIVENHPSLGTVLYEAKGSVFQKVDLPQIPGEGRGSSWGLHVADINHDGWSDFYLPGGAIEGVSVPPYLYVNTPEGFRLSDALAIDGLFAWSGLMADMDLNGSMDVAMLTAEVDSRTRFSQVGVAWQSAQRVATSIRVEMRDEHGHANQQGREIRLIDPSGLEPVQMALVDGGSGWLVKGPYPISFFVPEGEDQDYHVEARFRGREVIVEDVRPGERLAVFADGEVTAWGWAEMISRKEVVEGQEDGVELEIRLLKGALMEESSSPFRGSSSVSIGRRDVQIQGLPDGVEIGEVKRLDQSRVLVRLAGTSATDYDEDIGLMRVTLSRAVVQGARRDLDVRSRVRFRAGNDAPMLLEGPNAEAWETYPYVGRMRWRDDEGETLIPELVAGPEWMAIELDAEGQPRLVGDPPSGSEGAHFVEFGVADPQGKVTYHALNVLVKPAPEALSYADWAQRFSPERAEQLLNDQGGDPDEDGLENLLEFALGGQPFVRETRSLILVSRDGAAARVEAPLSRVTQGLDYRIEGSVEGQWDRWDVLEAESQVQKNERGGLTRVWRIPFPERDRQYFRVVVSSGAEEALPR